jgi:hypothetical protein
MYLLFVVDFSYVKVLIRKVRKVPVAFMRC